MNWKRPALNPRFSLRESPRTSCNAQKFPIRSATAIGPPFANMDRTALPTSICLVCAIVSMASWKKSVQSPTSPSQCGMTGRLLRFCTSVDRCA